MVIRQLQPREKKSEVQDVRQEDLQSGAEGQGKATDDGDHLLLVLVRHSGTRSGLWILEELRLLVHVAIRSGR